MDAPAENHSQDAQAQLLDRFLALAPTLKPIRPEAESTLATPAEEPSTELPDDPALAENWAKALLAQGKRREAAALLLRLAAQMPAKSAYFADLLDGNAAPANSW